MKKYLVVILLGVFLIEGDFAFCQTLRWQKRFSWTGTDDLTDVVALGDSTFLTVGDVGDFSGVSICRFNSQGDTLYRTSIPIQRYYVQKYQLCRLSSGEVYVGGVSSNGGSGDRTRLGRINVSDGTVYWMNNLQGVGPQGYAFNVNDMTEGPNSTILLAGDSRDPTGVATSIGYLVCYDMTGTFLWDREFREHPTFTLCNHIEQTPDGHLLVSGTAGSRIWATELENFGPEIRRNTFYQNIPHVNFDYSNAWVFQAPGQRYLVSGMIRSTTPSYYLGLHQGWAGPKIWGGEKQQGNTRKPVVNSDGSIVYVNEWSTASRMIRLRADSTIRWSIPKPRPAGSNGTAFYAYASLEDSSAIGVGIIANPDSTDWDWYVARITNMGIPYDPSQVVSVNPKVVVKPYAYPTPCRESLGFSGLRSPAKLELVDMQGRMMLTTEITSERMVDVSALVSGLYQYRLSSSGQVYSGRVMKE